MAPCLYFGSSSNLPPHFGFTLRPRNWLLVYFLAAVRICLHILVLLSVQETGSLSIFWQQFESASTFWFYSPSKKLAPCLFFVIICLFYGNYLPTSFLGFKQLLSFHKKSRLRGLLYVHNHHQTRIFRVP